MKKLAFSVFAAALTFGANAAESVETAPAASESCCGYDGFYFGLGIAGVNGGIKTETTDAYVGRQRWNREIGVDSDDSDTKFAGSLTLGYGRRIQEKAYIGLEAGLDATKNSNFVHAGNMSTSPRQWEVYSKVNGLTPSVALKLGYVHPGTRGMVYLKAGAAYSVAKANYTENDLVIGKDFPYSKKVSKWSPIIALGGEKLCGKNIRTRLEVEYKFKTNGKVDFNNGLDPADPDYYNGTVKVTNKDSVTLRAMAVYTVRM
ncbi:MAG: hypothetical protein J6T29_03275 [Alphaproteobacteria bacterium]|nr:hypothetical protein [Alphaproteobacteria bacterium]